MFLAHHGGLGGASISLLELVVGLRAKGLDCEIVLPRTGFLSQACHENSVPIRVFESDLWAHREPPSPARVVRKLFGHGWRAFQLARLLRAWKCERLVSNNLALCEGAFASRLAGIPHIAYVREFGDLDHGAFFEWGTQRSLAVLSQLSQRTIFNSQAVARYFARSVKQGTGRVVYNSVTVPEIQVEPESGGPFRCLLVGSLHPAKGQLEAVQAIAQLVQRGRPVQLDLLGPEGDRAYLAEIRALIQRQGLEHCVRLLGPRNPPECYAEMARADVLLMCSRMEAFGRVTVEAMKLGRPVIGAASGGTSELLEEGTTGMLYQPGQPHQLAEKIAQLEADREWTRQMGRQARQRTHGRFTRESYADAILTVLQEPLSSNF